MFTIYGEEGCLSHVLSGYVKNCFCTNRNVTLHFSLQMFFRTPNSNSVFGIWGQCNKEGIYMYMYSYCKICNSSGTSYSIHNSTTGMGISPYYIVFKFPYWYQYFWICGCLLSYCSRKHHWKEFLVLWVKKIIRALFVVKGVTTLIY